MARQLDLRNDDHMPLGGVREDFFDVGLRVEERPVLLAVEKMRVVLHVDVRTRSVLRARRADGSMPRELRVARDV